jgi:hypothetical protein
MALDFTTAPSQQDRPLIPNDTLVKVCMEVTHGGGGPDGWLTQAKTGNSLGLDAKFKVMDGEFKGCIIFNRFTLMGPTENHKKAAVISNATLRAILESAKNVAPGPTKTNPEWLAAMRFDNYGSFHGLCFLMKVGVTPAKDGYEAKNNIKVVIIPGMPEYFHVDQVPAAVPTNSSTLPFDAAPLPSPAVSIDKPKWANS